LELIGTYARVKTREKNGVKTPFLCEGRDRVHGEAEYFSANDY
jgi:hypothetical protein